MNAFEKWLIWTASVLTGVTGIGYFFIKYLMESSDPFSVVNHPLEPWFLKAHILLSPLLLVGVGSIMVRHLWKHFRLGAVLGRKSGIGTASVFFPMAISGYLIQSITHPGRLAAIAISHLVLSGLYLAALAVHQVVVHLRQQRRGAPYVGDI